MISLKNTIAVSAISLIASMELAAGLAEGKISGATVTQIYLDSRARADGNVGRYYGGCLVELSIAPSTIHSSCQYGKVTLLCDGSVASVSKQAAATNLSAAQLALVTGDTVDVWVVPDINVDGACAATGIWNN